MDPARCLDDSCVDEVAHVVALMPAFNFVAIESGLEDDPKLLSMAKVLGVKREAAFWYVYRWRVLIVQQGMYLTGSLPKKYTAQDLASFVDFRGAPRRLIDAMKEAGFLSYRKGCGFFYPAWKDTVTGDFAADKERRRIGKAKKRADLKDGPPIVPGQAPDVPETSRDASPDQPGTSHGHPEERNERSEVGGPPGPPRAGGSSIADERWEWLLQNAPTPQNPDRSKKYLAVMSDIEWAVVRRAYGRLQESRSSMSRKEIRDLRVLSWATDKFLQEQAYLRFRVVDRPKRKAPEGERPVFVVTPADELKQRLAASDDFVLEFLGDPEQSDLAKEDAKRRWKAVPENADRCPPWVDDDVAASRPGGSP